MSRPRDRFYKDVSVEGGQSGFAVLLDGKPIRTPSGAALSLPARALADAVAEEWRAQGPKIDPLTMKLTKLANTAIDRVGTDRALAVEQIIGFARSDLVCYRAEGPAGLVARQQEKWDPVIAWAKVRHAIDLKTAIGISFIDQPPEALSALARPLEAHDDFALTGLNAAATLAGSAIIALALIDGRLSAGEAFAAAELDRLHQEEVWGRDDEADRVARAKAEELAEIARFSELLKT